MRASPVLLAVALGAAACTPPPMIPAPALAGQSASAITAKLGPPQQQQIDGRTAYVWQSETRGPQTPVTTTRVSYAAGRPNSIETMSYPDPPEMETCTLRAYVDGAGRIVSTEWDGSNLACSDMQQKLGTKG